MLEIVKKGDWEVFRVRVDSGASIKGIEGVEEGETAEGNESAMVDEGPICSSSRPGNPQRDK